MDIFDTGLVKLLTEILHIRCLPFLSPLPVFFLLPFPSFYFETHRWIEKKKKKHWLSFRHTRSLVTDTDIYA